MWSTLAAISSDVAQRRAVRLTAAASLLELAALADASEQRPQSVYLVSDGDKGWVDAELSQALAATPAFAVGGVHPLHIQVLSTSSVVVVRSALVRRDWALRPPYDWRMRLSPWLPLAAVTAGLLVAWAWHRVLPGVVFAGASAFACVMWLPWPVPVGMASETFALQRWLRIVLATTPDVFVGWGSGVIVLALLGVWLDGRRSRSGGRVLDTTTVLASVLLGLPATLAWLEAAWTCGLFAWWTSGLGLVAWPVATCAWIIVARRATKLRRA